MARCRWFEKDLGSEVVFWFDVATTPVIFQFHLLRKSTTIDLASSEGSDGMKVDNDRLAQLRGLGRHESRPSIGTELTFFT